MKKIINNLLFLVLFLFLSSCRKNVNVNKKEYFYKLVFDNKTIYSHRTYNYIGDTLIKKVVRFDSLGNRINSDGQGGYYLVSKKGLSLLRNFKKKPYLSGLIYTKVKDSCVIYFDPYYFNIKNCYKGQSVDGTAVFNSMQEAIDGFDFDIYLDSDYTLVKRINNNVFSDFKEEVRIDKSEVPLTALKVLEIYPMLQSSR